MALGRVLLENAALLQWLLIDPVYRLDLYCISDALYRRRWRELIELHFQARPEIVAAAREQVDSAALAVADFFGNTIHKWAQVLHPNGKLEYVNFDAMMKEVAAHGGSTSSFQHDVVYFLHSAFVHSTASSMRAFWHLRLERYVRFDLGPNDFRCDEALDGATIFLFQVLQAASQYFQFDDIEAELDALFARMKSAADLDPVPDAGS